jgi:hypothetical protein
MQGAVFRRVFCCLLVSLGLCHTRVVPGRSLLKQPKKYYKDLKKCYPTLCEELEDAALKLRCIKVVSKSTYLAGCDVSLVGKVLQVARPDCSDQGFVYGKDPREAFLRLNKQLSKFCNLQNNVFPTRTHSFVSSQEMFEIALAEGEGVLLKDFDENFLTGLRGFLAAYGPDGKEVEWEVSASL